MKYDCDVAVIGAGPAGSRTARDIARHGFKVLLIEEHQKVGIPSHCSGLISPRTWDLGEIGGEPIVINRLRGAYVHTGTEEAALGGGPAVQALAIDRIRWDELLAEQAYEAGVEPRRARFLTAERENGAFRIATQTDGKETTLRARLLIGADGAHSRVARSQGMGWPTEGVNALGIEGRLRTPREDFVHVFVGSKLAPGWFGWIIPLGSGKVRAGIGCYGWERPLNCYHRLLDAFPQIFGGIEVERMYGGPIPTSFAPRSYGWGTLLVGDAAGQVKPFSGGGIYTALVAAGLCAETAIAALEADDLSPQFLSRYEDAWKEAIGKELRRSLHIRRFGLSLSDSDVDRIVRALRHKRLTRIAEQLGDIDYPSRSLLGIARALPALAPLARIALRRPWAFWQLVKAGLARG